MPGSVRSGVAAAVLLLSTLAGALPAHANSRFGPPWQAQVSVASTTAYSQPDPSSAAVGPLSQGALVVVLGQPNPQWDSTNLGFVRASDLQEQLQPWIAQVTVPSLSIYARPFAASGIRRTAKQGDLLRVTGVAPDLAGSGGVWWATTEGYVDLASLQPATDTWGTSWTLPDASLAPNGFWTRVASVANVRAGPSTDAPVVGQFSGGELVKVLQQVNGTSVGGNNVWDYIDGGRYAGAYVHSSLLSKVPPPRPNLTPPSSGSPSQWIVVDRSAETLTLVQNGSPQFVTFVALGEAGRQTPLGDYATFLKYVADDMTSTSLPDSTDLYDLPNVPYTQYYLDGGYAIHGTYWHDLFGTNQSHGCINITWTDSAYLFGLTQPTVPHGQTVASASSNGGQATPVVIVN